MQFSYYTATETGFYYLQSRYYDPVAHRFINADSYASTGQGIVGTNMFAYCLSNPSNRTDKKGTYSVDCKEDDPNNNEKPFDDVGGGNGAGGNSKGVRGVGGKGWRGDRTWKQNVKTVAEGGEIRELNGGTPTIDEARALIAEARGTFRIFHSAHPLGGRSIHTYNHIHYLTQTGIRSAIEVQVHI